MTTAGPCCNKSGGSTKNDNQQFWTKIHMKTGKSKQNIHAFPRSSVVNVVWIRFCPLWPGCSKARTHRFKMWPQRGEGEVENFTLLLFRGCENFHLAKHHQDHDQLEDGELDNQGSAQAAAHHPHLCLPLHRLLLLNCHLCQGSHNKCCKIKYECEDIRCCDVFKSTYENNITLSSLVEGWRSQERSSHRWAPP